MVILLTSEFYFEGLLYIYCSEEEMESATRVQILDVAVCISIHANALGKGINPPVLAMAK